MSGFAATGNKSVEPHGVEAAIAGSALGGGKALTVATVERNIKRKSPRRKGDPLSASSTESRRSKKCRLANIEGLL